MAAMKTSCGLMWLANGVIGSVSSAAFATKVRGFDRDW
jgi:hypothetical protein